MSICLIPGCESPHRARGYCAVHYNSKRLGGDLPKLPTKTLEERFWAKVNKTDSCWLWTGAITGAGYGNFWIGGGYEAAHRVAWRLSGGAPVPRELVLDHLCRNRACVNPEHVEPVTQAINVQRGLCPPATRARHLRRTHCIHGHPLFGENVTLRADGSRRCRICNRASVRKRRLARKEEGRSA